MTSTFHGRLLSSLKPSSSHFLIKTFGYHGSNQASVLSAGFLLSCHLPLGSCVNLKVSSLTLRQVTWQENRCRIYSFGLSGYRAVSSSPSNVECYCEAQCWSLAAQMWTVLEAPSGCWGKKRVLRKFMAGPSQLWMGDSVEEAVSFWMEMWIKFCIRIGVFGRILQVFPVVSIRCSSILHSISPSGWLVCFWILAGTSSSLP